MLKQLRHSFKLLLADKRFVFINLLGMACGLACCILLGLYLQNELSFDRHYPEHEYIYRVVSESISEDTSRHEAQVYFELGDRLESLSPEILNAVSFSPMNRTLFRHEEKSLYWTDVYTADADLFALFPQQVLWGDPLTALTEPGALAVSESFARTYFADKNPIGETIISDIGSFRITMVFADLPDTSHLKFDVLMPHIRLDRTDPAVIADLVKGAASLNTHFTYLKVSPTFDPDAFQEVSDQYSQLYLQARNNPGARQLRYYLEPLLDVHLYSVTERDLPRGSAFYLYAFSGLAAVILIIACSNYINLSAARYLQRSKEIQIRLIIGAGPLRLFLQFLLEAQMQAFLALLPALLLAALFLESGVFGNMLSVRQLTTGLQDGSFLLAVTSTTLLTGLMAGLIPAFRQLRQLIGRNRINSPTSYSFFRLSNIVIFMQVLLSVCAMATSIQMFRQLWFVESADMGFDETDKVVIEVRGPDNIDKLDVMRDRLLSQSSVINATWSKGMPGRLQNLRTIGPYILGDESVHYSYLDTMGIDVVRGRNFGERDLTSIDETGRAGRVVLVNEAVARAAQTFDVDNPIGRKFGTFEVIGVIQDFHFLGREQRVEPLVLYLDMPGWDRKTPLELATAVRYLIVHFQEGQYEKALSDIRGIFQDLYPDQMFEAVLLEDFLAQTAARDRQRSAVFAASALLCIVLACMGLYSMTAYAIERRAKEISIRKVLGAGLGQLLYQFNRDLLVPVLLAGVAASVLSQLIVNEWLKGFYYQLQLNVSVYIGATLVVALLVSSIVVMQTGRIVGLKPATLFRYD